MTVLIGLRFAQKPADENHKYGHTRAETIASLIASIIMFIVGLQVVTEAFKKFFSPTDEMPELFTAFIGLFSAIFYVFYIDITVNYQWTLRVRRYMQRHRITVQMR